VHDSQIEIMIDQIAHGVLETADLDLLVEVHRQQLQAFVDRFEARHQYLPP